MGSKSEVGHAKNVVNYGLGIDLLKGMDDLFNPGNESITLVKLLDTNNRLQLNYTKFKEIGPEFKVAISERAVLYAMMNKKATRLLNAFLAFNLGKEFDDEMMSLVKKLRGQRIGKIKKDKPEEEETETISVAQVSFDSKADTFDKMIKYAEAVSKFKPNETDVQPAALNAYYNDIMKANSKVSGLSVKLFLGRKERDEILYDGADNTIEQMRTVKKYLKSFEAGLPFYKKLVKLRFKDR
ncbi:hypothetical protein ACI6PS_03395 [Flavobacterium sp. PLA-1-15]|uniref:hypothetical protein n=1 Tax=Flavobacterium sp. PLA-1-15 TaxID=3380533 RepID=UPI003B7B3887